MKPLLLAFAEGLDLAGELACGLDAITGSVLRHRFPDRESLVRLDGDCRGREVIVLCSLRDPDDLALPLLFAARTARELGARRVGLVAPYLAYMRQDARFHPGEAVSSTHYAAFLSWTFDWLVTVDPHLHRRASLAEIFAMPTRRVSAMPPVAEWIRANVAAPLLIGPDEESRQWVQEAAARIQAPFVVLAKHRRGDRDVEVSIPGAALPAGRTPVLLDDIAASGGTLIQAVSRVRRLGGADPVCVVVHGLFADACDRALLQAGAARVVSTDAVPHATNAIGLAAELVPAIRELLAGKTSPVSGGDVDAR
ncbi:ribose-phosphate diphosphokinase [Dokdonella ginsengisoli]|uniref:Ribose-phosphate diphosphokinase n=1 Tax=Dokdonella ginsengisoli TaxID=363846 RepID=A0ABV9QYW1_9GAMM